VPDTVDQFREAMAAAGLPPPALIVPDGKLHRFPTNGRRNDDAGWYVLHDDEPPAGAFGDWRSGTDESWRARMDRPLSPAEDQACRARIDAARRLRQVEQEEQRAGTRRSAERIWANSAPAAPDHPYLRGKQIQPHGVRVYGDALVVPVTNGSGLDSLQFVSPTGTKRFLKGGATAGGYFLIGEPGETLCVAEGFATAASVREATTYAVAVAFNAGNLPPVARALRTRFPDCRLIVCADDDVLTPGNPGRTKGREAAEAVGGLVAAPVFGATRPAGASDFNDLHRLAGAKAVRAAIAKAAPAHPTWMPPGAIVAELRPVPAFDPDTLLPDVLRRWIMDEAERMPCPPEFVAAAALVALGSIVGARCAIRPKARDSWLVVPNLWGGIVGDPAAKKSPAWGAALRPVDQLVAQAQEAHRLAVADFEMAKILHDARAEALHDGIKKAARKGDDATSLAGELRLHAEEEPAAPSARRYRTNDTTVEKLGELLRENPAGLLVLRDELVGLLATWEREGREGERAFFLEAWNGNQSFDTDRIGRGHISIPNLCVSIFGGIQPDKLTAYLEQAAHALANDGMLQRFQLLVYPDARRWEWRDRGPDAAAREAAFALFETLANFDPLAWGAEATDAATKFPCFRFDEDGQEVFIEWSRDLHLERLSAEDEPLIRQHLAKYDKLFPALALLFQLVEGASGGKCGAVSRTSALRAAAWCEFLEAHARRCYGLLKDDGLRAAQALAGKLRKGLLKEGFTGRDVRRNQWRHLTTDESIEAALDWLEDESWIRGETSGGTGPGSGRRTVRYSINPVLTRPEAHA